MATAVRNVELGALAPLEGLGGYDTAFVVFRYRGVPVGEAWLPVAGGRVPGAELRAAALQHIDGAYTEMWLRAELGVEQQTYTAPTTIAITTRDRPDDVARCLEALHPLVQDGHELLVVDNCPSDDRGLEVVRAFGDARYVREHVRGVSAARNRAMREARHDIVAFSDDDATPEAGWLPALLANFDDPMVMIVGGLTLPFELETPAQEWFQRFTPFGRGYRRVVLDPDEVHPLQGFRVGAGANLAIRRSVLELVGPWHPFISTGTASRTGEDFEMFGRVLAKGYRMVYEPAAVSWHRHRRDWAELRHQQYTYGIGAYVNFTKALLEDHEALVPKAAMGWLLHTQLPRIYESVRGKPGSVPLDLLLAELKGCIAGPGSYFRARRQYRAKVARGEVAA